MFEINPDYQPIFEKTGIDSPSALLEFCSQGDPLHEGTISTVWHHQMGDCKIYAKRYEYDRPRLRYRFYPSRGKNEVRSYRHFRHMGIPCPDVTAFAEHQVGGRFAWCLLVTREIPNSLNLQQLFSSDHLAADSRLAIMKRLGQFAAQMHRAGFYHRDLKLRNVLLQADNGQDLGLHFIDCPRGRKQIFRRDHGALYDLRSIYKHAHLYCSTEEWHALLAAYADARFAPSVSSSQIRRERFLSKLDAALHRYFPDAAKSLSHGATLCTVGS